MGSSCFARGNEQNLEVIESYLKEHNLEDEVDVQLGCSLCKGQCSKGPNISVNGKDYHEVEKGVLRDMLRELFENKQNK
jgi:NADH:ubiquinone oxidoreductase subunit E